MDKKEKDIGDAPVAVLKWGGIEDINGRNEKKETVS
jgi:hypothetical protein